VAFTAGSALPGRRKTRVLVLAGTSRRTRRTLVAGSPVSRARAAGAGRRCVERLDRGDREQQRVVALADADQVARHDRLAGLQVDHAAQPLAERDEVERGRLGHRGGAEPVAPGPGRACREPRRLQPAAGPQARDPGERHHRALGRLAREPHDPGAATAVVEERPHAGLELGAHGRPGGGVAGHDQLAAEHRRVARRILDRHRHAHRAARREAGEPGHVHARQHRRARRRLRLEREARHAPLVEGDRHVATP
jgi:hypothetical protein